MGHLRNGAMGLSVGVLALFACSRVASQTNFIGHPCKLDADCPSDLVCANEGNGVQTCQNRCLAGATCQDPSQTCINGACLSGARSGAGADGGDFNTTAPDSGFNTGMNDGGGSSSGGSSSGQGTTLASNIAYANGTFLRLAGGGSWLTYTMSGTDGFGNPFTALNAVHTDGSGAIAAPLDTVAGSAGGASPFNAIDVRASTVFWLNTPSGGAPSPSALKSQTPGVGSPTSVTTLTVAMGEAQAFGQYIYFVSSSGAKPLSVYDIVGGTTTQVSTVGVATTNQFGLPTPLLTSNGTEIFWLEGAGAPWAVHKAPLGAGTASAVDTQTTIPAASPSALAANGSTLYYVFSVSGTTKVYSGNTATPGSLSTFEFNLPNTVQGTMLSDTDGMYLPISAPPNSSLAKIPFATKQQATIVDLPGISVVGFALDSTNVYWAETANGPGATMRIAAHAR